MVTDAVASSFFEGDIFVVGWRVCAVGSEQGIGGRCSEEGSPEEFVAECEHW